MKSGKWKHGVGLSAAVLALVGIAEAAIMISPFAAYFYTGVRPALNFLSRHPGTAWLDGFFLNHALITTSPLLEGQRLVGKYLFAIGVWGFLCGFLQVYLFKVIRRPGVARVGLYWVVRHPQYLCLILAGWGLLTIWPRFVLLVLFVSMVFVYVLLARFEEARMEERFPEIYRAFRQRRGGFLPWSPGEKIYALTFGRIRNRPLGFLLCYLFCLFGALGGAFLARAHVVASTSWVILPEERTIALSVWPRHEDEIESIMERVFEDKRIRARMEEDGGPNFIAHILPYSYGMIGMYVDLGGKRPVLAFKEKLERVKRIAKFFLLPRASNARIMGHPVDKVLVVISRCSKVYRPDMPLEECFDPGVKLRPVVLARTHAEWPPDVSLMLPPVPRHAYGDFPMPIF